MLRQLESLPEALRNPCEHAIRSEILKRITKAHDGVIRYQRILSPVQRVDYPTIWQDGNARLLDVAPDNGGAVVLLVPSLINRHHIFDLTDRQSMVQFMAGKGMRPVLLDWGEPNSGQTHWTSSEYVGQLGRAAAALQASVGGNITLLGYCMGGNLALAHAVLHPEGIAALALLATPWDFHAPDSPLHPEHHAMSLEYFAAMLNGMELVPPELIQLLFYQLLPFVFMDKFRQFADCARDDDIAHFAAIEHWVNNGMPMSRALAQECLNGWVQNNILAKNRWVVEGTAVDPGLLEMPVFMALPTRDRIVTPTNAGALARQIPHATLCYPETGHVGMVAGMQARTALWRPLSAWLSSV